MDNHGRKREEKPDPKIIFCVILPSLLETLNIKKKAMTNEGLHEFRVYIDRAIQMAEENENEKLKNTTIEDFRKGFPEARANEQVVIKLKEAKMWVGKVLEARGSELPKEFQDKA